MWYNINLKFEPSKQLKFHYSDYIPNLFAGLDNGCMVHCRFCTRDNNATNNNANINLASN